jgi:hypothetical protein
VHEGCERRGEKTGGREQCCGVERGTMSGGVDAGRGNLAKAVVVGVAVGVGVYITWVLSGQRSPWATPPHSAATAPATAAAAPSHDTRRADGVVEGQGQGQGQPGQGQTDDDVTIRPLRDKRGYRQFILDNGLRCLVSGSLHCACPLTHMPCAHTRYLVPVRTGCWG